MRSSLAALQARTAASERALLDRMGGAVEVFARAGEIDGAGAALLARYASAG